MFYCINTTGLITSGIQIIQILYITSFCKCNSQRIHCMMTMIITFCPVLYTTNFATILSLTISVSPNLSYFSQLSSCITSISCQSSRKRSVIVPVVGTTNFTSSSNISRAFFAIYCESRKSRSINPLGYPPLSSSIYLA